jgi:acetyl-CoA synthetase
MLACARIGATHTVIFGGFAADAIRGRVIDCQAKAILTQDGALRRGKVVPLKATVDQALTEPTSVEKVFVLRRLSQDACPIEMRSGRDFDWETA